jgi:NAD-dependent DNA ligase
VLEAIKDIWPGTAGTIIQYFQTHQYLLERLLARIEIIFPEKTMWWKLTGMTFCVTGTFDIPRDDIHSLIESNGGEVRTAVSGNLNYLIAWKSAGSKKQKAESLDVGILSLDDFQKIILSL